MINSILICDLKIGYKGHNLGYMLNLLKQYKERDLRTTYHVLVPPTVFDKFYEFVGLNNLNIYTLDIDQWENICNVKSDFVKRIKEWKLIDQFATKLSVDEIMIMDLDQYQFIIGLFKSSYNISGIYFRPHYRMPVLQNGIKAVLRSRTWRIKKQLYEYWMCRNNSLKRVFILNDKEAVTEMNIRVRNVFRYLPDPIFDYSMNNGYDIRSSYNINKDQRVFLLFGSLSDRKNAINIIEAFTNIDDSLVEKVVLLIVGSADEQYYMMLTSALESAKQKKPQLSFIVDIRYVSNSEMETIFSQSDVVLLIYKDLYVSSGVLGIAAKYGKYCIVSDQGLVSELVDNYNLGSKASPECVTDITRAVQQIASLDKLPITEGKLFYLNHRPEDFAKLILNG